MPGIGIPAGEEKATLCARRGQSSIRYSATSGSKLAAAQVEILLEIIKYENHALGSEGLCQEFEANAVVEVWAGGSMSVTGLLPRPDCVRAMPMAMAHSVRSKRPTQAATSHPSSASRCMALPARALLPEPPMPVSTTPAYCRWGSRRARSSRPQLLAAPDQVVHA